MGNELTKTDKLPYSYHTFLLAVQFDCEFVEKDTLGNWEKDSLREPNNRNELMLNYQTYQYFTPEARKLMFNEGKIKRYKYRIPDDADRSFVIVKTLESDQTDKKTGKKLQKTEKYCLTVDNIRVTVFQNHIAILQFELENHDEAHRDLEFIKKINEYGRRINMPFVVNDDTIHPLVSDSISILGNEVKMSCFGERSLERFRAKDSSLRNQNIIPPILTLIRELLPNSNETTEITPVIDDRMFVCCLVRNESFSQEVQSLRYSGDDPIYIVGKDIYTDRELSNKIYSFAFIDAASSSCQSPEMREALLKRCIYSRWRDWGTIDVVTHHSFVRITGESESLTASVINPFLTQYVTMATGVLLQRATLMKLSKDCADISSNYFEKTQRKVNNQKLDERIKQLKREYVFAQNNIFLTQFTAQEQGIDEFDMLRNEMYIKDSLKNLSHKVNGIYDFTTENAENEENRLLNALTIFGLPLSLMQILVVIISFKYFEETFSKNHVIEWGVFFIILAVSIVISVVGIMVYKRFYRARKNKRKTNK